MNKSTHILSKNRIFTKINKIDFWIKAIVVALLSAVIYRQILVREDAAELWTTFLATLQEANIWVFVAAIILMPINWILESKKWQLLSSNFERQSLKKAIKTVLGGLVFSLFTPARVGEYGGRILFVKAENNWKAVAATLVGSLSQLLVVLFFGGMGLIFLSQKLNLTADFSILSLIFIWTGIMMVALFSFFNIDIVINLVKRIGFLSKFEGIKKTIGVVKHYSRTVLLNTMKFSLMRYFVYCAQYILLLSFFGIKIPIAAAASGVTGIFFIQTGIPLPPVWDLLARGEVAIQVWSIFGANKISILAATFSLWVINLIIPSLLGIVFIAKINVLKSIGYE